MSFHDLPDDWPDRPLTDPLLVPDVLDLVVGEHDRVTGCVGVLVCDADCRLVQPMVVSIQTADDWPRVMEQIVSVVLEVLGDDMAGVLIVALGRPDGLSITDHDRLRCDELRAALAPTSWSLGGVHLITVGGSRLVAA